MKKKILVSATYLAFASGILAKDTVLNINTTVFNTGTITNQGILDFGQNSMTLGSHVWDTLEHKTGNRFLAGVGAFWVYWGWFWNEHEFGHGTRKQALGINDTFKPPYTYNFPTFFIQTLIRPVNPSQNNLWADGSTIAYELGAKSPYVTYSGAGANRSYSLTNRGQALVAGGGFANDSQWAEHLEQRAYLQDNVHVSVNVSHTLSKILPVFYVSKQGRGDLAEIAESIGVSQREIRTASLISLLASSSTYRMWGAMINGETYVRPHRTDTKFRMPDVSAYFTHGISYKINSGYKLNNKTYIPLAFETVTKSTLQKQSEITVGAIHTVNDTTQVRASAIYNLNRKGVSLTSKISKKINDKTTAYISAHQYNLNTMYGERNTTDFRKTNAQSVYLGVDISF